MLTNVTGEKKKTNTICHYFLRGKNAFLKKKKLQQINSLTYSTEFRIICNVPLYSVMPVKAIKACDV